MPKSKKTIQAVKSRPRAGIRTPKRKAPELEIQALERRLEADERGGATVQLRNTASTRQGTLTESYVRRDGTPTRAASIHFRAELHDQLRLTAATGVLSISGIVNEAVASWFAREAP